MKKLQLLITGLLLGTYCLGAYLKNVPVTLTQPDGTVINCFATGDEYYNWAHDSLGYTIVQSPTTGYYYYATLDNDSLVCSNYIVGNARLKSANIQPNANISPQKIMKIVKSSLLYQDNLRSAAERKASGAQTRGSNIGTINNIVIFIRFADQDEFPAMAYSYSLRFNGLSEYPYSLRSYFREVSYNKLEIISHFFPDNDGIDIVSYQDTHNIDYYRPYNAVTNSSGYTGGDNGSEQWGREDTLLQNAINSVKNQIARVLSASQLDHNNDGFVDNVCFVVQGVNYFNCGIGELLWSHHSKLYSPYTASINGKTVRDYNFIGLFENTTVHHEMNHTLGAPDLYHYNQDKMDPVGIWDLMGDGRNYKHMTAYMKYQYGGWIDFIPVITTPGTYTLQPLTSLVNNCYKIFIQGVSQYTPPRQYIVLEYRKSNDNGVFESDLPGSGLIIYRINDDIAPQGNRDGYDSGGVADEVYVFRPDGKIYPPNSNGNINNAYFSETAGRTEFGNDTNPYCFRSNGAYGNIYIKNIRENANGTLSFDFLRHCNGDDITYSDISNLPTVTSASNSIQTTGTVTVKSTDDVTFSAGNKVVLNPGFKVELGGTFEIDINECEP